MEIIVNEEAKELTAIGKNDIEQTIDLLGSYNALHYNEDLNSYTMSKEKFDWWEQVIKDLNKIKELEEKLLPSMDADTEAKYRLSIEYVNEIDDIAKIQLEFLENYTKRK